MTPEAVRAQVIAGTAATVSFRLLTNRSTLTFRMPPGHCEPLLLYRTNDLTAGPHGVRKCENNRAELLGATPGAYRACSGSSCVNIEVLEGLSKQQFDIPLP